MVSRTDFRIDIGRGLAPVSGQRCTTEEMFYRRGRWYDGNGRLLGHGDLSKKDVATIKERLAEGDLFVVVSAMQNWPDTLEEMTIDRLVTKFPLIITKGRVFFVTDSVGNKERKTLRAGVRLEFLTPEMALKDLFRPSANSEGSTD